MLQNRSAPEWDKVPEYDLEERNEQAITRQMIRQREERRATGADEFYHRKIDFDQSNDRAHNLFNRMQKKEMAKTEKELERRGQKMIRDDPNWETPVSVVSIGAALWTGREMLLMRNRNFRVSSQVEGRGRNGRLTVASDEFKGELGFDPGNGMRVGLSQRLDFIASNADVLFYIRKQHFTTEFTHALADHWGVKVGTGQLRDSDLFEGNAGIYYETTF
jgi:hypothetical protein